MLLPYFLLAAFSLFLAYPAAWLLSLVSKNRFLYGDIVREAPVALLSAAVDTITCALPIFVLGLPGEFFVLAILPGTLLVGFVYQRFHSADWRVRTAYLFALLARLVQLALLAAFMWQTGYY